jgi:hypothetical protein
MAADELDRVRPPNFLFHDALVDRRNHESPVDGFG